MKCLACDFGGSSVKYALVNDRAQLQHSAKLPAPLNSTEQFVNTVGFLYDKYCKQIDGIAISMPGYIAPETGFLFDSGAYRPLYGHSIIELLKERCPVPIAVENDGKCAALAEMWDGSLVGCKDAAVVILGSGVAGGIIKDGKVHGGSDYVAGEFSYLITDPNGYNDLAYAYMSAAMHGITYRICKAKNIDLSVQDSGTLLEMIDQRVKMPYADPEASLKKIEANGVQFFKWIKEGDPQAEEIYRNFINALAVVVHNIQICFAPEKIAIGGGLSLEDCIFSDLKEQLQHYYKGIGLGKQLQASIVKSRYLGECNLIGAAYNYMTRYSNQMKAPKALNYKMKG